MKSIAFIAVLTLLVSVPLGWFSIPGLLVIFHVFLIAVVAWRRRKGLRPLTLVVRWARFLGNFFADLAVSNLQLAWDVLTPTDLHRPRLVAVPVGDLEDLEIAILIHRITLTPGTLTCDLLDEPRVLLVHAIYGEDEGIAQRLRYPIDILKGNA